MTRVAALLALAMGLSGCGLLLDGAFLVSSGKYSKDDVETKRTGLAQVQLEHEVRVAQGQVWLACEDVQRTMERQWNVHRDYQYVNGWPSVHWLPLIVETIVGGALGIGFGLECGKTHEAASCNALWAVPPLALDAIYSAVRLATIEPAKLINKTRTDLAAAPSRTADDRKTVACEPDAALVVGRSPEDPLAVWFRVDAWGAMNAAQRPQLLTALQQQGAQVWWVAGGNAPRSAGLSTCEVRQGLGVPCPQQEPRQ